MEYKIHITTEDSELLNTIIIDTDRMNWDTNNSKSSTMYEIFDEIYRAEKRRLNTK
jgi:hypothetical protein